MSSSELKTIQLRKSATADEYRVYRAGLEWDLTDPIVIETRKDLKSESRWRDRLEPYNHQVTNLITFCRRLPVTLLADDVGLGKTISAGLIMSELMARSRLSKTLIVCPKLLCCQWQEELKTKFDIVSDIAFGKDLITVEPKEKSAVITTYNSARLHLDSIKKSGYEMLILDEAHKLRNLYGTENTPQVALLFQKALNERRFRFVLMLTATPIQNRLWDIYSLVDLLTVARGHENPFGDEDSFDREFIADKRTQARRLQPARRDEFRSIVYSYMSRIRRGDAKLIFPDRIVRMEKFAPSAAEIKIIATIVYPVQHMNKLSQISLLQAAVSSPEALLAQLTNMDRNGTVPPGLLMKIKSIVAGMPCTAKLKGLWTLISKYKKENPAGWRLVVFTCRRETQKSIQNFLEDKKLKVGIINGDSGQRNQETIACFRKNPPEYHVIVSTEAGSEGINLQVANVLVNYDLPWNPMIVEQRIGRIQRLASDHANVTILNITLSDTFEENIVSRLMEKLHMAAHAIGDIEAILEASGLDGDEDDGVTSFEEKIRRLVIDALAGKNVEEALLLEEQSIDEAKERLKEEKENIDRHLGGMDGAESAGPRVPNLPGIIRSMDYREFSLAVFKMHGANVTHRTGNLYLKEKNGSQEYIYFGEDSGANTGSILFSPGSVAFQRLVDDLIRTGIHAVEDLDLNPGKACEDIAKKWVRDFGGNFNSAETENVCQCFCGNALVRVRATVAHDSYERLVDIPCNSTTQHVQTGSAGMEPLARTIENPSTLGIDIEKLSDKAIQDKAISEFSRFYLERREQEILAAGSDDRKRKKLKDEFTPSFVKTLVTLEGKLHRQLKVRVQYTLDGKFEYCSTLTITPHVGKVDDAPKLGTCSKSNMEVPRECLKECQITGGKILAHLLVKSEISPRYALPEHTIICGVSGKTVLKDEAECSYGSGRMVAKQFLRRSAMSGKRAEPAYFGRCDFTDTEVLNKELIKSEVSGKSYRIDEQEQSVVSKKKGHKSEFIICNNTRKPLLKTEAEQCEETGKYVIRGILEKCAISQKCVLPSELEQCTVLGRKTLKKLLVTCSTSGSRILKDLAVRSSNGRFCSPLEVKICIWSGRKCHPEDIRICELTGLPIHFEFASAANPQRLMPLLDLLCGTEKTAAEPNLWKVVSADFKATEGQAGRVESTVLSPDKRHLAVCVSIRKFLGFRVHQTGFVYDIQKGCILGRVCNGRRLSDTWSEFKGLEPKSA